ncbi:Protein GrpE [subsurface metagenome]
MSKKTTKTAGETKNKNVFEEKKSGTKKQQVKDTYKNKSEEKDIKAEVEEEVVKRAEDKSDAPVSKINKVKQEAAEWHDKYLRLSAEFDNYRKRTLKEKADLIRLANEELLKDILSVVDDFERGLDTIDKSDDLEALKAGIHLIYSKFSDFIKQKGLKEIEALEKPFDIDYHEAMTKIPASSEKLKGKVVDVIEKGYLLNDKVIRYAKVVVGE